MKRAVTNQNLSGSQITNKIIRYRIYKVLLKTKRKDWKLKAIHNLFIREGNKGQ